jgi:pimeloyl-ACP methyl ester carboxylesterase
MARSARWDGARTVIIRSGSATGLGRFGSTLIPTSADPKLARRHLPDDYLTTRAGTRGETLYHLPTADPTIVDADESLKQTGTLAERNTLAVARSSETTHAVRVPTLVVVGQYDSFYCENSQPLSCADTATVMARESGNYSPAACLRTVVIPDAGHAVNLNSGSRSFSKAIDTWLGAYVGHGPAGADANGCRP